MKKNVLKISQVAIALFAFFLTISLQGMAQQATEMYEGNWKSDSTKITVRTKVKWMKYKFHPGKVMLTLNIHADQTASGTIGEARFQNVRIRKNKGKPSLNGIVYILELGTLGKFFPADPSNNKLVELWVKPISNTGILLAEIRLRDGWDTFPMGEGVYYRNK